MAVLQMQKIHICALKSNRKQILEELQRTGTVQVESNGEEDEIFRRMDTASVRSSYEKRAQSAEAALKVLDQYAPEKKGLLSSLKGTKEITVDQYYKQVKNQESILRSVNRILSLQRHIGEDRAAQMKAEMSLETLTPWMALDVPMNYKGTRTTAAIIGTLPGHWVQEQIPPAIAQQHPELEAYSVEILGADKDQTCIFAVCAKAEAEQLEDALRLNGFVRPTVQTNLTPAEYAGQLEQTRSEYAAAEKEAIEKLKAAAADRVSIQFVADYYTMRAEKYEVPGELLQSNHVFFINGYIPAKDAENLKSKLEQEYSCSVELSEVPEDEQAPVLMKNNAFAAPTEGIVQSFGFPGKGEIDPTGVMAFFYYFLFGLMLSDAGYGLLMAIGCFVLVKKYPKMGAGMKQMMTMFMYCGIFTTFWGVMFGSYFGDLIPVIADTFFHKTITIPAVWFVPEDPMKLLIYSFLFGIIHLFTGLGVKGYMLLKEHKVMDFLCTVMTWYALLIGLILMLLPTEIFASMAGSAIVFPAWLNTAARWWRSSVRSVSF